MKSHAPFLRAQVALLSTVVACVPALAQVARMDPVIVTATRIPQPASALLSDVRIIDSADLANAGNESLLELLRIHAGVEVATNGGPGQTSAVFLRGTNANHVVVLIDGVRVNSATSGTNAFENIPLNQIERIEVLRGPASSLYGADAIGGVIQIFTRRDGNRAALSAGAGRWNTQKYSGSFGREFGATRLAIDAGYEDTRAFSATNQTSTFSFNPDTDPYRNKNVGINLGHAWAPGHEVAVHALISEGVAHFDAGLGSDDVNRQRLATYAFEARDRLSGDWNSTLRLARGIDDIVTLGGFPGTFRTEQDQLGWQNDIGFAGGRIAAGLEYRRERVESTTEFSVARRSIRSAYAGYSGTWGAHLLQLSARHDDNSQFGARTTGNVGYGYRITPAWRISASGGTAFKAPSFNDLYFVSPFFNGNQDLRPERATSRELALRHDGAEMRAGLTLFRTDVRDLIAVDPTFSTVINVNDAQIRGGTLDVGIDFGSYRLKAEATHQQATDVSTSNWLPRRARNFGALSLLRNAGALRIGAEVVASGERFDSVANYPTSRLAGYALLNLRTTYLVAPGYSVSVRWNNAFDRQYELARGYNTARSNVFVSVDYATQ